MLYEKDSYLNNDSFYYIGKDIYEYDMTYAGLNLCKYYNLLSKEKMDILNSLTSKKEIVTRIGIFQRDDSEFKEKLKQAFIDVRKLFFEANKLDDEMVHSIKKDAIFTYTPCDTNTFDNIRFINKNIYTSYYKFDGKEFYYNRKKKVVDVKGISDTKLSLHKDYMLEILFTVFGLIEKNKKQSKKLLKEFINYYKYRELMLGYYRELNEKSVFIVGEDRQEIKDIDDLVYFDKHMININFNFETYILPIVNILF